MTFEALRGSYTRLWDELIPSPAHKRELDTIVAGLLAHKATYQEVSQAVWRKPDNWFVVALLDQMEGGGGARTYLGNGQSLAHVTTEVPAGRGPFANFLDGAIDALHLDGLDKVQEWPPSAVGYWFERYNGTGYMGKPIIDPYLASWSNKYTKGKYVADHVYDPEAVSQQPGALTILKVLVKADPSIYPAVLQPEVTPVTTPAIALPTDQLVKITQALEAVVSYLPMVAGFFPPLAPVAPFIPAVAAFLKMLEELERSQGDPMGMLTIVESHFHEIATAIGQAKTHPVVQATVAAVQAAPHETTHA